MKYEVDCLRDVQGGGVGGGGGGSGYSYSQSDIGQFADTYSHFAVISDSFS